MSELKRVTVLPAFPMNSHSLQRGTILEATHEIVAQLGMEVGDKIPIGYDGKYVRCGPFAWDIEQIIGEITAGIWSIAGVLDLSDPEQALSFTREIERLEVVH